MSNHLTNVLVTLSDKVQGVSTGGNANEADYYEALVISANDYYPFGLAMSGRKDAQDYRYGFNGKENDKDWGTKWIQDYGFRLYNPSIARFLSVDPLGADYPWYTPYQFAGNQPIRYIDLDGAEPETPYDLWVRHPGKYTGNFRVDGIWVHERYTDDESAKSLTLEYFWHDKGTEKWKRFKPDPITQTSAKDVEKIAVVSIGVVLSAAVAGEVGVAKIFNPKLLAFNTVAEFGANRIIKGEWNADVADILINSTPVGYWWGITASSLIDINTNGTRSMVGGDILFGDEYNKTAVRAAFEFGAGGLLKLGFDKGADKLGDKLGKFFEESGSAFVMQGKRMETVAKGRLYGVYGSGMAASTTSGASIHKGLVLYAIGKRLRGSLSKGQKAVTTDVSTQATQKGSGVGEKTEENEKPK